MSPKPVSFAGTADRCAADPSSLSSRSMSPVVAAQRVTATTFHAPGHHLAYLAVGIANSAPLPMLDDQRCMIDFCRV